MDADLNPHSNIKSAVGVWDEWMRVRGSLESFSASNLQENASLVKGWHGRGATWASKGLRYVETRPVG